MATAKEVIEATIETKETELATLKANLAAAVSTEESWLSKEFHTIEADVKAWWAKMFPAATTVAPAATPATVVIVPAAPAPVVVASTTVAP